MDITFTITDAELAALQSLVAVENTHRMELDRVVDGAGLAASIAREAVRFRLNLVREKRVAAIAAAVSKADSATLARIEAAFDNKAGGER